MRVCKNVDVSKQFKNMVTVLAFFDQQRAQLQEIRITERLILQSKSKINRSGYKFSKYFR